MGGNGQLRLTMLTRILLFLAAFCAALLLQLGISNYQLKNVIEPMEQRTDNIQSISQFLNDVDGCMTALAEYRWDYGNASTLILELRERQSSADAHLEQISSDLGRVSEEQYLLANAARTTYDSLRETLTGIIDRLLSGRSNDAADLYYGTAEPCGAYLQQYTQQLLEQAILDNQDAHVATIALNDRLNRIENVLVVLCMLLGCVVVVSVFRLLRSVRELSRASQAISLGEFDTPDIDESQRDEIGQMARAFNEMKRSMKRQVTLLSEKNAMQRELHAKERETLELQTLMEREKLQQLRSQINPHFLFNTLNMILYTCRQEGAVRTASLLTSLSRLLRYSLISNETQVPLSREIQIVNEFFALYQARFGEKMAMQWDCAPELDLTETQVPSFVLQPLVENAFTHGLGPKESGGTVRISVRTEDGTLRIEVADDGVGMSVETLKNLRSSLRNPPTTGEHIGIYNVAARLRLLGSRYGLDILSRQGEGTQAILRLPLVTAGEEEYDD